MKRILYLFVLIIYSCSGQEHPVGKVVNVLSEKDFLLPEHSSLIYEHLKSFPNQTEVAFAIIQGGKTYFYGVIRKNDTIQSKQNQQAIFEIGSITKVLTSTLLAGYVVEGKLQLEDNINEYLEFTIKDDLPITFKSLANHTSGLPRMPSNFMFSSLLNPSNPYENYDEEQLKTYLTENLELDFQPGSRISYSNLGAGLLGYTLANFSEQAYEIMLRERIFNKYGMDFSTTVRGEVENKLVPGLDYEGNITSNWDLSVLVAAGGVLSSTEDLSKFALAQFDTTNLELNLTRSVTYKDSTRSDIGLGWFINNSKSGNTAYWHNGGTGGYRSSLAIDCDKQNAVIILSNISAFHDDSQKIDDLCFTLLKSIK